MRIALFGHGKMGRTIAEICSTKGHEVVLTVDSSNAGADPSSADVAIEFSRPDTVLANVRSCVEKGVPIVVGTTGWYDHLPEVSAMVSDRKAALLWASNFSIGVNLLFRINRQLAALMDPYPDYAVKVDEAHHVHKLDSPSGTALSLARDIDLKTQRFSGWEPHEQATEPGRVQDTGNTSGAVPILSERTGEVPGKHSISWTSDEDRIVIMHEAFGRKGFALGAVHAAEWLADPVQHRRGIFTMDDVLRTH